VSEVLEAPKRTVQAAACEPCWHLAHATPSSENLEAGAINSDHDLSAGKVIEDPFEALFALGDQPELR
jgi:hypothetical protein